MKRSALDVFDQQDGNHAQINRHLSLQKRLRLRAAAGDNVNALLALSYTASSSLSSSRSFPSILGFPSLAPSSRPGAAAGMIPPIGLVALAAATSDSVNIVSDDEFSVVNNNNNDNNKTFMKENTCSGSKKTRMTPPQSMANIKLCPLQAPPRHLSSQKPNKKDYNCNYNPKDSKYCFRPLPLPPSLPNVPSGKIFQK